ncbi:MAG: preprotein translocase subunit SecE [Firmicutes bacterium]|nr:preprotein translocase subunit SecE [Bacillota bacterium]
MKKIAKFFNNVKKEMQKVKWPNKKDMITYSLATISIMIIFGVFFTVIDLASAGIKVLIGA